MKRNIITSLLLFALLLAFVSIVTGHRGAFTKEVAKINYKRPGFTLMGIDSKKYSTDQVNKPLVINF